MWNFLLLPLLFPGVCGLSSSVKHRFHMVKEEKTWTEAQQHCREKFTDLATIDDIAEVEKIKRVIQDAGVGDDWKGWIGLKHGNSAKWHWSLADKGFYGDNEAEFRNWAEGEPEGKVGEDCAGFPHNVVGKWADFYCTNRYPFICYNSTNTTHPYVLESARLNWTEAQRYCRENHADLASVRNQAENDVITAISTLESEHVWIGLFKDAWEWSDGSSSSFRHWLTGEPNYGVSSGLCVEMMSSGQWNDAACNKQRNFVCYEALVKRTQIVRVEMEASDDVAMEDPNVQESLLQQIRQKLKANGLPADTKLSWQKQPGGKVFHKREKGKKKERDEF